MVETKALGWTPWRMKAISGSHPIQAQMCSMDCGRHNPEEE